VGIRFNPPPNWPPPPPGFVPPPRWQPDPSWPPPPPGWQLWVEEGTVPGAPYGRPGTPAAGRAGPAPGPGGAPAGPADFLAGPDVLTGDFPAAPGGFRTGPEDFATGPVTAPHASPGQPTQIYPGGPHGPAGQPGPPPASGRTNGFAIASFVLGLIGVGVVFSVVCGIVALRQIRRAAQRGRGLAIAGLALSAMWVLIGAGVLLFGQSAPTASSGSSSAASPSASSPAAGGSHLTNVFSLATGDCFQNPPADQTLLGVTYVGVVPCTTPHNAQVFVEFPVSGTSYPGISALKREADQGCHARIPATVKKQKITDAMTLRYLYPLRSSWADGHRSVTCLIVNSTPSLTSSLLRTHPAH
jgi:Domain of unknown function (DUF4190)/Septum formation